MAPRDSGTTPLWQGEARDNRPSDPVAAGNRDCGFGCRQSGCCALWTTHPPGGSPADRTGAFWTAPDTASACDGGHWAAAGVTANLDNDPVECLPDATVRAARCCADVDTAPAVDAVCQTAGGNCEDGDACTIDYCDTNNGCAHDPDPACP